MGRIMCVPNWGIFVQWAELKVRRDIVKFIRDTLSLRRFGRAVLACAVLYFTHNLTFVFVVYFVYNCGLFLINFFSFCFYLCKLPKCFSLI
uniref:Uncharacterized protein n=1 Tax=Meloidogyne enterolobii TaxID=390850 RepID=A0A6V7V226_MELEN|nr:unnamed protein product [Meloidogyne enterolobii]